MKHLWRKRRPAALGALAVAVGVTMWVVLPALASTAGDLVAPWSNTRNVYPTDVSLGGNSSCGDLGFSGLSEYDISTPKTTPTNKPLDLGSGVKLGIKMDPGDLGSPVSPAYAKDKYFNFTMTGGAVVAIGVKGGTETTKYDYSSLLGAPVTADTYLHAPAQSWSGYDSNGAEIPTQLYSVSQLTICYQVITYIEGKVYVDTDQSGGFNSGDTRPTGWTINLYKGVTPGTSGGGTLVDTQQTVSTGSVSYHFDVPADGTHYRVCEVPSGSPAIGDTWVETQPVPSTTTLCNGTNELAKGYDWTPTDGAKSNADFGNVGAFTCSSTSVGIDPYTVGDCKSGQTYVFNSGVFTSGSNNGVPFVSYFVGAPSGAQVPDVELINFPDPFSYGQPTYTKLLYADGGGFPVTFNNLTTMPYCKVDPRQSGSLTLSSSYDELSESGAVLPGTTSCVISIRITAPVPGSSPPTGALQAYVYALGDSIRSAG